VILLVITPNSVDFNNTWHLGQLRSDDPVLNFPQCHGIKRCAISQRCALLGFNGIHEDFTKARGNGAHFRLHPRWQCAFDGAESLIHQIAGKVDIGTFLEYHSHLG